MSISTVLLLGSLVLAQPAGSDVLIEIDSRYQRGEIDAATRHLYRVAAIKRPGLLPVDLREQLRNNSPGGARSASRIFWEAYHWVSRNDAWGGALHMLLQPPDDLQFVLESSTLPIRVSYALAGHEEIAQSVLQAAEVSWDVQINDFGFHEPIREDGYPEYRFYVDHAGGAAGYTAPYDQVYSVDHAACYTYIVIDPSSGMWGLNGTVAHEVNHSMQATMDCVEVTTFWENTAEFVMAEVFPQAWGSTVSAFPYFQQQPWRALDYMNQQYSDAYEYGGGLLMVWLADAYGDNEGGVLAAEVWEACMQFGFSNSPHYYHAITDVVASRGGATDFEDIFLEFSEARFFVGEYDDGAHIRGAGNWWDAEVALTARHHAGALPILEREPPSDEQPAPYGVNYIVVDVPSSYEHSLQIDFDGEDSTRWAVRLIRFDGMPTDVTPVALDDTTWAGSQEIDMTGWTHLLLMVANLGKENYSPNSRSWPKSTYVYSIQPSLPPPSLIALEPAAVLQGSQNVSMRLIGSGFVSGEGFNVSFDDPTISVGPIESVTDTDVIFSITVPLRTEAGAKDITVTNAGGKQATGQGLLTVESPEPEPEPGGCDCRHNGDAGGLGLILALGLLGFGLRRRRTRRFGG